MKFSLIKNIYFATHAEKEKFVSTRRQVHSYLSGFIFSMILTLLAYFFVVADLSFLSDTLVMALIICCAAVQLFVQVYYFLHLGSGSRPRWNLFIFILTLLLLFIIVGGSLWIMASLNERMMPEPPSELNGFTLPKASE